MNILTRTKRFRERRIFLVGVAVCILFSVPLVVRGAGSEGDDVLLLTWLNTLFDYDVSVGYSDNAYLWPSNRVADGLVNIILQTETRKELSDHSAIYISSYIEKKTFFSERVADELSADAYIEYSYSSGMFEAGISDLAVYEDYRISDDLDGLESAGDYQSWSDRARFAMEYDLGKHNLAIDASYRAKRYQDMAFDFAEMGYRLLHYWYLSEKITSRLICAVKQKTYDELQATSADGEIHAENPLLAIDSYEVGFRLRRRSAGSGRVEIEARYKLNDDRFAEQDSYNQIGVGASGAVQIGIHYAATALFDFQQRNYMERVVDVVGTAQTDNFVSCKIMIERVVYKDLCAYVAYELEMRNSNFDPYDYRENMATVGLKQLL
ncbi:MAG: DUF560 domain-containing protein [Lentisphaerae bacterium]|nr:DUF560 domain-containing protein [Lentisphaerota bacterium]